MTSDAPIGVFDSGVGGISVIRQLRRLHDEAFALQPVNATLGADEHRAVRILHDPETRCRRQS